MSDEKERTYSIDLDIQIEYIGEELPSEEVLLTPIKNAIRNHLKTYKNTCRLVFMKSTLSEDGYGEAVVPEET
jgi:hypothetical protein